MLRILKKMIEMYYFKKVHYRAKQVIQPIPIYKKHKKNMGL